VVLAPAMNTLMWEHPLTARHLRQLAADAGAPHPPMHLPLDGLVGWMNQHCPRLRVVAPTSKQLACGDVGVGAMAGLDALVAAVSAMLSPQPKPPG
jgi:phosphopantothenoylcysteine decarboxylase